MKQEETAKEEYITEEMINEYLTHYIYFDNNGVVHTTKQKYFINNN